MAKTRIVHDPYRNIDTTLAEFAKAEGVPKYTVSHYYWVHRSLDGFRDRPAKGTGNGIKPHTYTKDGAFVTMSEAARITIGSTSALNYWRKRGITDIDEINRRQKARYANTRQSRLRVADDGREYTPSEYAKNQHVRLSTVTEWLRHHGGSLKGFTTRGGSRVNPTKYEHTGLGIAKTIREWAKHFGVSVETIKTYLYAHGRKMDGYIPHYRRVYAYKGKSLSVTAWAHELCMDWRRVKRYLSKHNGSLEGIEDICNRLQRGMPPSIKVERDGETHTLREWSAILDIPVVTVRSYWHQHRTLDGIENRRRIRRHIAA